MTLLFLFSLLALTISIVVGFVTNPFAGAAVFVLIVGSCIKQGMRRIPADPLTKGVKTFMGAPQKKIIGPGWHFFFFFPLIDGYIKVNAEKVNQAVSLEEILTPDGVSNRIPVSIEWEFDDENPLNYLESGKEEGIRGILENIITERIREWLNSREEGPQNYSELREAGEEATNTILKAVLGDGLEKIPSSIPTPILLKYFREPQKNPTPAESKDWGKKWEKVTDALNQLTPADLTELKAAVQKRREQVKLARQGQGNFRKTDLGIRIMRLTLGNIEPTGDVLKEANEVVRARLRRDAENVNLDNLCKQLRKFQDGGHLTPGEARTFLEVERKRATRAISEHNFTVGPEIVEALKAIVFRLTNKDGRT
jgi:regulator of protease activity HflC (stomatin/prohibitin superfamily)